MKTPFLLLAMLLLLILSCDENVNKENPCSVDDPIQDLIWLADEITEMSESGMSEYLYVTQANYRFSTVFLFKNCCRDCLSVVFIYNCSGEIIGEMGSEINTSDLRNEKVIWKSANSTCNL